MDANLKTVLRFTAVYAVMAVCLLAAQPRSGATQTADAGGNFEAPAHSWLEIVVASAE